MAACGRLIDVWQSIVIETGVPYGIGDNFSTFCCARYREVFVSSLYL